MTAANEPRRAVLNGNGTTGPYPFSFGLINVSELVVTQFPSAGGSNVLTQGVDYTVSTTTNSDGFITSGSITTTVAIPGGGSPDRLVITASTPLEQSTIYPLNGTFPAKTAERDFDAAVFRDQELDDAIKRSILLPTTFQGSQITFPEPTPAGQFVRANGTEDGFELASLTGSGTIGIPVAVVDGGTGATTSLLARSNLGIPISSFESIGSNETVAAADIGKLFLTDTSSGVVDYALPALSSLDNAYSIAIAKRTGANDVTITPNGADAIVGFPQQNSAHRIQDIGGMVILTKTSAGVWWAEAHVNMIGATSVLDGRQGRVPAPTAGQENRFLRGDGTWQNPPSTDYQTLVDRAVPIASTDEATGISLAGVSDMIFVCRQLSPSTTISGYLEFGDDIDYSTGAIAEGITRDEAGASAGWSGSNGVTFITSMIAGEEAAGGVHMRRIPDDLSVSMFGSGYTGWYVNGVVTQTNGTNTIGWGGGVYATNKGIDRVRIRASAGTFDHTPNAGRWGIMVRRS